MQSRQIKHVISWFVNFEKELRTFGHYSRILWSCGYVILKGPIWIFWGANSLSHGSAYIYRLQNIYRRQTRLQSRSTIFRPKATFHCQSNRLCQFPAMHHMNWC